ncbi:hypothetical protein KIW84_025063 [Lathyrus oleraceus]|uniref:Uncharacterized protein n=1 Tax=Pisum sativum TaxID=3888 RepID=A0A9D4YJB8_PEA|nr:hypothetical protein KIW84_025063 [Pisum sativum]
MLSTPQILQPSQICIPFKRGVCFPKLFFKSQMYKCLANDGRICISKDVIFNELRFSYSSLFASSSTQTPSVRTHFISFPLSFSSLKTTPTSSSHLGGVSPTTSILNT